MTKVVFKITAVLASLLVQVYDADIKIAIDSSKIEMSRSVSDSVSVKHAFKPALSINKKNQPS
ncbi:hypothetical protein [Flavobacterium noncentrifugens]|uniref:Uncharacterized protein n=1 Tax=Flavobacterium noncentrifugens TaxID=1128970 RepID=A0A1G9API1_9FLAO|nr:hypothetical protein [Flavobacterium noncentrifugens]SDK29177.1 hypothetical protein SAMN04487935_2993 [Flavobacterium noncentrifugens]